MEQIHFGIGQDMEDCVKKNGSHKMAVVDSYMRGNVAWVVKRCMYGCGAQSESRG